MLLCYLDESRREGPEFYYMGALVLTADQVRSIEQSLNDVVDQVREQHPALPVNAELHAYEMFQGERAWNGVPPGIRAWASQAAVRAVCAHAPWFGIHGVDVQKLAERYGENAYEAHEVSLSHLLAQVQRRFRHHPDAPVLALADDHHLAPDSRSRFAELRRIPVKGLTREPLDCFLDNVYFGPSHHSRLLQAVDLLTFFSPRPRHETDRHPQAARRMRAIEASISAVRGYEYFWTP